MAFSLSRAIVNQLKEEISILDTTLIFIVTKIGLKRTRDLFIING